MFICRRKSTGNYACAVSANIAYGQVNLKAATLDRDYVIPDINTSTEGTPGLALTYDNVYVRSNPAALDESLYVSVDDTREAATVTVKCSNSEQ